MKARGFTLIEMILAVVVLGILGAMGGIVIVQAVQAYRADAEAVSDLAKARYAVERVVREVRIIARDAAGVPLITTMNADRMRFQNGHDVEIQCRNAQKFIALYYDDLGAKGVLGDRSGCGFTYYQQDGSTQATTPSEVAFVEFILYAEDGTTERQVVRIGLRH